ncbi:probable serine/threonine-protein kinase PBL19 isoform X1, partial [Tanacetum coccineum]
FPDVAPQILHLKKFTYRELNEATDSFSESSKIAEGEYGPIYKAVFEDPHINVDLVVKRLKERLVTGEKGLGKLRLNYVWIGEHPNLVKLVGYCSEGNERGLQRLLFSNLPKEREERVINGMQDLYFDDLAWSSFEEDLADVFTKMVETTGYAAPECSRGRCLTPMCDTWSYGVFLYELITGRAPLDMNRTSKMNKKLLVELG